VSKRKQEEERRSTTTTSSMEESEGTQWSEGTTPKGSSGVYGGMDDI